MHNHFLNLTRFLPLVLLLSLWFGCQNTDPQVKQRQMITSQLPPPIDREVDSLLQIITMMSNSNVPKGIIADMQGEVGLLICERLPEEGIHFFEKILEYNYSEEQWNKAAELHMFIARLYDQKLQQPGRGMDHLMKAEMVWEKLNYNYELAKTLQQEALLEAKLNRIDEGKNKIRSALDTFQKYDDQPDIHELYFDLAQIHHLADEADSSLFYLNILDSIWHEQRNIASAFTTNNLRLRIFLENDRLEEANDIYTSNEVIRKQANFHWMPTVEFLYLSRDLMKKSGKQMELAAIENEYQALKDSLNAEKLVFFEKPLK